MMDSTTLGWPPCSSVQAGALEVETYNLRTHLFDGASPITRSAECSISFKVPGEAFGSDALLVTQTRGRYVETVHRGTFAVVDNSGRLLLSAGDAEQRTFMRSSAKPFQAMALMLTGAADALDLTDRDIAIACSSHSGEPEHIEAVMQLLEKGHVPDSALRCGVHPPLDKRASDALLVKGQEPGALHNNCSGKHAGMLVTCQHMGWPLETYQDKNHPLQRLNLKTLSAFTDEPLGQIGLAVDGCGVPVFHVPVRSVAASFSRLATGMGVSEEYGQAAERIRQAMMLYPFLVAGSQRFDTELMELGKHAIVCKGGAQGGEGAGVLPSGTGVGLKITDGSSASIAMVMGEILSHVESLSNRQRVQLEGYTQQPLRNHARTIVGENKVAFHIEGFIA